jgi:membrane protein
MDATPPHGRPGLVQRTRQAWAALRAWPWADTLSTLRRRFADDRLALTAGSLTFTTLIALVPLLTVMLAVFTAFPVFASFEVALERYFLQNLVPDNIARPVMRWLTQFAGKARGIGAAGLVLLGVTALAMALTIDRTLNAIWRVRRPRPIAQRVLVYWAALTLGPLVLGISLSFTSYVVSASHGLVGRLPGGVTALLDVMQFGLLAAAAAGLFHYVPHAAVRWRHAWAGGLFVAGAFELAKKALAWWVDVVGTFSAVYGAFATVPILLLWIYLVWVIVLLGAVIAAYAPSLQMRLASREPTPGWPFELSLAVLHRLAVARAGVERGLTAPALAEALSIDPLQLEPVLDMLSAMDWIGRLDEGDAPLAGGPRLVLLADPAATPLLPLVNRTLLAPGPLSAAFRQRAGLEQLTLADALAA